MLLSSSVGKVVQPRICTAGVVQLTHIDFFCGFLLAFLHVLYVSHKLNLLMLSSHLSPGMEGI